MITESSAHSAKAFTMAGESSDWPFDDCTVHVLAPTAPRTANRVAIVKQVLMVNRHLDLNEQSGGNGKNMSRGADNILYPSEAPSPTT